MVKKQKPQAPAEPPGPLPSDLPAAEINGLADQMARSYAEMVRFYRRDFGLSDEEAHARATDILDQDVSWANTMPAERFSWHQLERLQEHDPTLVLRAWQRIKTDALDELDSGQRAATVMEWNTLPWERAQFLAVRASFRAEWQPRGGIEDSLVDMLAQCYSMYLYWMTEFNRDFRTQSQQGEFDLKDKGYWNAPRISTAEWIAQSADMVDRFNRLYLRTLRALRDLRRYSPTVIVQNAGQVNVGALQQNITQPQPE